MYTGVGGISILGDILLRCCAPQGIRTHNQIPKRAGERDTLGIDH
jgi:hypothetical protein